MHVADVKRVIATTTPTTGRRRSRPGQKGRKRGSRRKPTVGKEAIRDLGTLAHSYKEGRGERSPIACSISSTEKKKYEPLVPILHVSDQQYIILCTQVKQVQKRATGYSQEVE